MFSRSVPHIVVMWMLYYHQHRLWGAKFCCSITSLSVSTYTEDRGWTSCSFHLFVLSMLVPISQCLGYDIFKLVLISGRSCTFAFSPWGMSWLFLTFDISIFDLAEISLSNYTRVLLLFWIGTAKLYRLLWERTEDLMMSEATKGQKFLSCLNTNTLAWRSWQKTHPWIRGEGLSTTHRTA